MFSNEAGEVTLSNNILQLRIFDGDCEDSLFRDILEVVQKAFRETNVPLRLILNSVDEEVSSSVISELVELLSSSSLNTEMLLGTAVILSSVQCTFAKFTINVMEFTKPTAVFDDEIKAAEFIAGLQK